MLNIVYSGRSRPSAMKIAQESEDINIARTNDGDINWGRRTANTQLNPDINNCVNKRVMRELFAEHGVPMPKLLTHGNVLYDAREMGISWDYPIVGRPDRHTKGRGFWLCDNFKDIEKALRGTRRKKAATHFMEYIDAPHELRVHIFLGKSIRISEKDATAFHTYTTIKPTINVKKARKAAKQAVNALGLDFGTVDVLCETDGTPYVLEVNAAPGLGGSMPKVWAQAFLRWKEDNEENV